MGDSDDDYDRKRRDKFRGERSEYRDNPSSSAVRRPPPANDWNDRGGGGSDWGSRGGSNYRGRSGGDYHHRGGGSGGGRMHPPHEYSPPSNKRPRVDWNSGHDGGGGRYGGDNYSTSSGYSSYHGDHGPPGHHHRDRDRGDSGAQLLSFKNWLATQDDTISDQEALSKYAEYKQEFKRQKLNEFFMAHRDEEWFKNKYHPDESLKRKEEQLANLKKRVNIFLEFLNSKKFDDPECTLDSANSDKIVKLMDWFVIRLEDGTDEDAAQLLSADPIDMDVPTSILLPGERAEARKAAIVEIKKPRKSAEDGEEEDESKKEEEEKKESKEEEDESGEKAEMMDQDDEEAQGKKRSLSGSSNESGDADKHVAKKLKGDEEGEGEEEDGEGKKDEENGDDDKKDGEEGEGEEEKEKIQITISSNKEPSDEAQAVAVPALREPLHRTTSIFIKNLAPTITKLEVESLCKKYSGFLRAALADPQPERNWMRRGWVTYKRNVNIKEICWNLNNIRLRDTELQPIVNKDLTRRIRTVNGITPHKMIVRNDIRLAAKLIQHLDSKMHLWEDNNGGGEQGGGEGGEPTANGNKEYSYGVYSANPVLKNITDYLIEEASAEEEELLGVSSQEEGEVDGENKNMIERDEELIRVLDRLLYYLRFVHSVDYYNHSEYPYEDEMPNRVGISHGRGLPPATKVNMSDIQDYNKSFEGKIMSFIEPVTVCTDEECKNLGQKDEKTEVEKFITSNTQELGKDKWLCPLSGKKFKGPEFVRKHILNKHGEKLEEVIKEVAFFNNFLKDPKRPEAYTGRGESSKDGSSSENSRQGGGPPGYDRFGPPGRDPSGRSPNYHPYDSYPPYGGGGGHMPPYGGGYYPPPPMLMPPQGRYGGGGGYPPRDYPPPYGGGRGGGVRMAPYRGRDHRSMISYRDLDAPPDTDDY